MAAYLETPGGPEMWKTEIAALRKLAKNEELEKTEGFDTLSYCEKQAQGYDHVCAYMGSFDEGDTFLDKLAEDVTNNALKTNV